MHWCLYTNIPISRLIVESYVRRTLGHDIWNDIICIDNQAPNLERSFQRVRTDYLHKHL